MRVSPERARGQELPRFPEMVAYVPAVQVRDAGDSPPAELTDAELTDAVARAGGRVLIGIKAPTASRSRATGEVAGISRTTSLAGRAKIESLGAEITQTYRNFSVVAATVTPELALRLRDLAEVDYVEPVTSGRPMMQAFPPQDTSWGVRKILAPQVWQAPGGQSSRGQLANIYLLDTGLDETHAWSSGGDGPENWSLGCFYVSGTGSSCFEQDSTYGGHGAHVAGTIAGRAYNEFGYIGIANNPAQFTSIKVCADDYVVGCTQQFLLDALDFVLDSDRPRRIVNISLGFCFNNTAVQQATAQLQAAGALVVASAGNVRPGASEAYVCRGHPNQLPNWQTSVMYPARYSHVMAVSGITQADEFADAPPPGGGSGGTPPPYEDCDEGNCHVMASCHAGSRYGPQVDIAAPFRDSSMVWGGNYDEMCGTSMSAAFVSGAAALVWSLNPSLTATSLRNKLQNMAVPLPYPATHVGAGRVVAYEPPPPPPTASIHGPTFVRPGDTCLYYATSTSGNTPLTYDWSVDGVPMPYFGPNAYHPIGSTSFALELLVEDAVGNQMYRTHFVTVDPEAPECLDA